MRKMFLLLFSVLVLSCTQDSQLIDLTPDTELTAEFAFSVPALDEAIANKDDIVQDTGAFIIAPTDDIYSRSPFIRNVQYVATDTFAFSWEDYSPVVQVVNRIANGYDITNSRVNSRFKHSRYFYTSADMYLIPLFNNKGQRYYLQVFRQKINFFYSVYTARGLWIISESIEPEGDVS